ncbi:unnamed protein product, partial [Pylaiella littoralis]
MGTIFIGHAALSFLTGLSVSVSGFGCEVSRELVAELTAVRYESSAINMGLSAALVTGVQATLQRRLVNGALLLNTLPLTAIGVVLSLNVFSTAALAALVPVLGTSLFGLSLATLWMDLADCRHKTSVRESDDDHGGFNSWKWTGVLAVASLIGGLLSGRCPPPGPAFMAVLLVAGVGGGGGRGALAVGGGEWRATAALVTCSASLLRVGLLLLENGASVGPLPEVSVLVLGGLVGLGAGNLSLGLVFPPRRLNNSSSTALNPDAEADRWHDTPPPAVLRRFVLAVALASSVALATGGPPAALEPLQRPLVAGALGAVLLVALCGALCGCTKGAEGAHRGARGAYGKVAFDDREAHEVELKPFVGGGAGGDETDDDGGRRDDDYLDEEDGYLADEGETEHTRSSKRGGRGEGGGGAGA